MAYAENFRGGAKFRHNRVTSQINFRGSAEGTTILGKSGGMIPGKFCKITPRNTHFCAFWKHRRKGRHFTGGRKKFALNITICTEWGLKPLVNLFYTVEFVYNGFVCNVNSPTTLHFVRSRWHLLHAFQFACNVILAITFFMQSSRGALTGKFCSYLAC